MSFKKNKTATASDQSEVLLQRLEECALKRHLLLNVGRTVPAGRERESTTNGHRSV